MLGYLNQFVRPIQRSFTQNCATQGTTLLRTLQQKYVPDNHLEILASGVNIGTNFWNNDHYNSVCFSEKKNDRKLSIGGVRSCRVSTWLVRWNAVPTYLRRTTGKAIWIGIVLWKIRFCHFLVNALTNGPRRRRRGGAEELEGAGAQRKWLKGSISSVNRKPTTTRAKAGNGRRDDDDDDDDVPRRARWDRDLWSISRSFFTTVLGPFSPESRNAISRLREAP